MTHRDCPGEVPGVSKVPLGVYAVFFEDQDPDVEIAGANANRDREQNHRYRGKATRALWAPFRNLGRCFVHRSCSLGIILSGYRGEPSAVDRLSQESPFTASQPTFTGSYKMRLRHGNLSLADLECAQGFAGGGVRLAAAHQDVAVAEDFVGGFDMPAGSAGGFEDRDVVTAIH